jgi:hypothetical protein
VHVTSRRDSIKETTSSHPNHHQKYCEHFLEANQHEITPDQLPLAENIKKDNRNLISAKNKLDTWNNNLNCESSTHTNSSPAANPALQTYFPQISSSLHTLQTPSPNFGSVSQGRVDLRSFHNSQNMSFCNQRTSDCNCETGKLNKLESLGTGLDGSNNATFSLPKLALQKTEVKKGKAASKSTGQNLLSKSSFSFLPVTGPMREIRALQNRIRIQAEHKATIKLQDACERQRIARVEQHLTELREESKRRELEVLNAALVSAFDKAKKLDSHDIAVGSFSSIIQSRSGEFNNCSAADLLITKCSKEFNNDEPCDYLPQNQAGVQSRAYQNLPLKNGSRSLAFTCGFESLALATRK